MRKRGVYFFVIDAFIGGSIVFVSLLLILGSYKLTSNKERPVVLLEDFMSYVVNTEVRDYDSNLTEDMVNSGTINNTRNTLFDQVGEFHYLNDTSSANLFIADIVANTLPEQLSIRYTYDSDLLYERVEFPYEDAGLVLTSKKISLINVNRTFVYGPYLVEVAVWTS